MVVLMGSNTCRFRTCPTRSSTSVCGPGSRLWAYDTLAVGMPLVSCSPGIHCGRLAVASAVGSRMSLVSSTSGSKASAACVGERLGPAHYWGAARSGRVDGCRALGPGCSRRRLVDPLPGFVGMSHP